ncbi:hypothetical protein ACQ7JZ_000087 [Vibrio parahaemolyticus]
MFQSAEELKNGIMREPEIKDNALWTCIEFGFTYDQYEKYSQNEIQVHEEDYRELCNQLSTKPDLSLSEKRKLRQEIELQATAARKKIELDYLMKQRREAEALEEKIRTISPSFNRFDYTILAHDYKRGNKVDNAYKRLYTLTALNSFDCRCANCYDRHNGFELDHFIFSKNDGGNFVMRSKDGYLVNNAVVLCVTCNRSKQDKVFTEFFSQEAVFRIMDVNKSLTEIIHKEKKMHSYCQE